MWPVLGADQGDKWPWPELEGDLGKGSRPKSGPNTSGKVIWTGNGPLQVTQASAEASEASYAFSLSLSLSLSPYIYIYM